MEVTEKIGEFQFCRTIEGACLASNPKLAQIALFSPRVLASAFLSASFREVNECHIPKKVERSQSVGSEELVGSPDIPMHAGSAVHLQSHCATGNGLRCSEFGCE